MASQIATRSTGPVQTTSTQLSPADCAFQILADAEPRTIVSWNGQCSFRHGQALSSAERHAIIRALGDLDADIASPLQVETMRQAARKFSTRASGRDAFDAGAYVDTFIDVLPNTSDAALQEATLRILGGKAPGISKAYIPTSAEVVTLADEITAGWKIRRDSLARLLTLSEEAATLGDASFAPDRLAKLRAMSERLNAAAILTSAPRPVAPGSSAGSRVAADLEQRKAARADAETLTEEMLRDVPDAPPRGASMAHVPMPDGFRDLKRRQA